ncbi:MAG: type II CAAX endopeptidase family protein [Patescibacteria group bacterium]
MPSKTVLIKHSTILAVYLLVVWGFYRFLFQLPEEIEELFIKPIVWLIPVIILLGKERLGLDSLGFTLKNLFPAIYLSLGLGAVFVMEALVINYVKYKGFNFGANIGDLPFMKSLGLSFATAFSEEVAFRGYLFNRIWYVLGREWSANILTSLVWALVHIPVTFFVWKLDMGAAILYLILTTIFGIGSAFVFARTRNILSSILLHVLWQWPIILFR